MATAIQCVRVIARRPTSRISTQSCSARSRPSRRHFRALPSRMADDAGKQTDTESPSKDDLQTAGEDFDGQVPEDASSLQAFDNILKEHQGRIRQSLSAQLRNLPPFREVKPRKPKLGALNMNLESFEDVEEDPEFEEDDISSLAHGQLEQHREYRHYARLAAWEMPLLTKLAKDFVPPTQKEVLRFRYTNYMGEQHPAEKKVVVEFCPADMPDLTKVQSDKLKKLAGSRWNPETDIIKMSCESFESQAQNKRYLGDLVDTLLKEARDPTDTFEDIPFDTRHHPIKIKPKFPVEWRMTEGRRAELEASRKHAEITDHQRESQGLLVDGMQQIQEALSKPSLTPYAELEAQLVTAGKGAGRDTGRVGRQRLRS